jgi:hypothetical protein
VPALGRFGLLVLAAGLVADLAYHALPLVTAPLLGADGLRAHLVVFVGMLLVVGGLVQQGLRAGTPRAASGSISTRGATNAFR